MTRRFYRREELVGKEVYNIKGTRIGVVWDVMYLKDGTAALIVSKVNRQEIIPSTEVSEVGDIVLLRSTVAR